MQVSSLLTARRSSCYVAAQLAAKAVNSSKSCRLRRHIRLVQLYATSTKTSTNPTQTSPIDAINVNLQNVKEYTAANPVSIWKSRSSNPYENLAIENYILKHSDPASKILFTYVNWPCVVIGRNQNPWLECNLERMRQGVPDHAQNDENNYCKGDDGKKQHRHEREGPIPLDLVRRRSGGGTVIHDSGNLNFSFIVPNDKDFTRDKHGYLVAAMLEKLRLQASMRPLYSSVRVNERHDIVMKRDLPQSKMDKEFKVSGSAFKLTRGRALHHGTILHSSPNIVERTEAGRDGRSIFSEILTSPAKSFLEAKGVGSVRSPVHNLFRASSGRDRVRYSQELREALHTMFIDSHDLDGIEVQDVGSSDCTENANKHVFDDIQELLTNDWRFCQTPSFEFASPTLTEGVRIKFRVKHGTIGQIAIEGKGVLEESFPSLAALEGMKLHEIDDWSKYLPDDLVSATAQLTNIFPRIDLTNVPLARSITHDTEEKQETKRMGQEDIVVVKRRSTDGSVETEKEGDNVVIER